MDPTPGIVAFVLVLAASAGVVLWKRRNTDENRLVARVGRETAERLIRFEQARTPGLSRPAAARRALERLEADRGR